jgi:ribosomal protein S18 acetylase RimI-like enzyme
MASMDPWRRLGRTLDLCRQRMNDPEYLIWIACCGGAPCAFLVLHPRGMAGSPYVASIGVAPGFQGRGIGAWALARAEEHFTPGARNIFLCVSSFNPRARALYERLGYSVIVELDDYVVDGLSEFLMRKRLQPQAAAAP